MIPQRIYLIGAAQDHDELTAWAQQIDVFSPVREALRGRLGAAMWVI